MSKLGEYVDVGEKDLFYVEVQEAVGYTTICRSADRVLFKVLCDDGTTVTVRVKWSVYKRVAQSRGYRGMETCADIHVVPTLHSRELHVIGSTYVEVTVRQYMEGYPLSEVWHEMSHGEREVILGQVEAFVEDMSKHTHRKFMSLQGRNLSTPDPVDYLNYKMLLSMITKDLETGDCRVTDMNSFACLPVLCHGSLSMEHVIVLDCSITGIVGWGLCDYVPEVMDRMSYHFSKPKAEGELEWYSRLSSMLLFSPPPPPLYTVLCAQYVYSLRLRKTPDKYHSRLTRKLEEAYSMLIPSVRQSYMGFDMYADTKGDRGSQDPHAEPPAPSQAETVLGILTEHQRPSTQNASHCSVVEDPFVCSQYELCSYTSCDSAQETESSCESWWEEEGTVLDILDNLSVL